MKRIYLITLVLLAAFSSAFAQDEALKRTFSIGPVIGFGHTGMRNVGYDDVFKPSYSAGVTMNYSSMEHIGFSADVLYSLEGGKFQTNSGDKIDVSLSYLRIPIKFAYFFGEAANAFRPKVTIGPSLGFLIDDKSRINGSSGTNYHLSNDYQPFDFGGIASVGFNYKMGERIWLNTDVYYYHGLVEIDHNNHFNSDFGLRVGVAFGL